MNTIKSATKKEDKAIDAAFDKFMKPIRDKIKTMELVSNRCDITEVNDLQCIISEQNSFYNYWATKFNKKAKHVKAAFSAILNKSNNEFTDHEFGLFKEKITELAFEQKGIMLPDIEKMDKDLKECYDKKLSLENTIITIDKVFKKNRRNEIFNQ